MKKQLTKLDITTRSKISIKYKKLLGLYPVDFRDRFGTEMTADFVNSYIQKTTSGTKPSTIWVEALLDTLTSSLREHFKAKTLSHKIITTLWPRTVEARIFRYSLVLLSPYILTTAIQILEQTISWLIVSEISVGAEPLLASGLQTLGNNGPLDGRLSVLILSLVVVANLIAPYLRLKKQIKLSKALSLTAKNIILAWICVILLYAANLSKNDSLYLEVFVSALFPIWLLSVLIAGLHKRGLWGELKMLARPISIVSLILGLIVLSGLIRPNPLSIALQRQLTVSTCSYKIEYFDEVSKEKGNVYITKLNKVAEKGICPIDTTDWYLQHPDEFAKDLKRIEDVRARISRKRINPSSYSQVIYNSDGKEIDPRDSTYTITTNVYSAPAFRTN
jgi:hypothetical protein